MEKTLVIHPKDSSTVFLNAIYKGLPDVTIITGGKPQEEVHQMMEAHNKIMIMGHGSPSGLFSKNNFNDSPEYIIDETSVPFLKGKNNVFVWCHADKFVERFGLGGFYTGMFISEMREALMHNIHTNEKEIRYSNMLFANTINQFLDSPNIAKIVRFIYNSRTNPVIIYNRQRVFQSQPLQETTRSVQLSSNNPKDWDVSKFV
jgi:hypothetical protein